MSIATPTFLQHMQGLYPTCQVDSNLPAALSNPWYIVTAVVYSSSNRPQGVPTVFNHVLEEMKAQNESVENQLLLARKLREAIFKSGLISGYSRTINSLVALNEVMPHELRESKPLRDFNTSLEHYDNTGHNFFNSYYGDTAELTQNLLDGIYPDLGAFCRTIGYGLVYGHTDILTPIETSYTIVAALIAADSPLQIGWHLDGAKKLGAKFEEVKAVREIAVEVVKSIGKQWENEVPEVTPA